MIPNISRHPQGLLDMLGIKQLGRYPGSLLQEIRPTLEMLEMLACNYADEFNLATAGTTGAVAAGFVNISAVTGTSDISGFLAAGVITLPQDELWYLQEGSTYVTLPAEAAAFGRTLLSTTILGQASEGLPSVFNGFDTGSAATARSSVSSVTRGCFLRPGRQLFIQHNGLNSVLTIAISARVRLLRLKL